MFVEWVLCARAYFGLFTDINLFYIQQTFAVSTIVIHVFRMGN